MDAGRLETWGGVECTVCRIGDRYFDQVERSGHDVRLDDLDRIASLGISHLRYPVLWERVAPNGLARSQWAWTDERLYRLKELGVTPIVTLLHHGSGPRETHLLDPEFPEKLARFASRVARRYPWLRYFTPINEPVTTARFSALYGWWYPHRRDERSFYRALFNQVAAIRAAMSAIREEIPDARFVSTEDLGKTYASAPLQYQADHENARRFLSYDLLCGRIERNPHMVSYLSSLGFVVDQKFEAAHRCRPDVLGFNYYVTGERWLDHRLDRYPRSLHGGNGRHRYVDVEAVRARREGLTGRAELLRECWERYRRPMAITEAHLACSYDEQIRWLRDTHEDLLELRAAKVSVRAMTVWSLLGAFDWNSMQRSQTGYYESGAFDVSGGSVRETPVAEYVRALARDGPGRPLEGDGWWRRHDRLEYA